MNVEYFIARRIAKSKDYKNSISGPIIKIAMAAIAIGMIVMLITIATGVGLQRKIKEKVSAFHGDIVITNFDTNFSWDSKNPIDIEQSFYPDFTSLPGITHIQVTALKGGVIRTAETFEGVVIKGVSTDYDWKHFESYLTSGRLPDYSAALNGEIILSEYLANRLNLKLGDKVPTYFINEGSERPARTLGFDLVGIFKSGFQEFDQQFLVADIRHVQRLNKWTPQQIGSFELFVDDFDRLPEIGQEVYANIDPSLDALTIRDRYRSTFDWIELFDFNIYLIIGIMIIVAGINMITALLVLILERTQMIGILKALGSTDWGIRKVFLYNAMYLIILGLIWGNAIGLGLIYLQDTFGFFEYPDPEIYYMKEAPVYINAMHILLLNVGTFVLCLAMLILPSIIIARISPVKAIRFE
ncbi:MAG: FtsX-like permease family protein [Gilvibacter sp.]